MSEIKWTEQNKDDIIRTLMDTAANLDSYNGVVILRREADGSMHSRWGGNAGFSQIDVIGMASIFLERQHMAIRYLEGEDEPDD